MFFYFISIILEIILSATCLFYTYKFYKNNQKIISFSYVFIAIASFCGALNYAGIKEAEPIHSFFAKTALCLATPAIGLVIHLAFKPETTN